MSSASSDQPLPPQRPNHSLTAIGLSLAAAGVIGWFIMVGMILAIPQEEYTGDGQRDTVIGIGNFFGYVIQVLIGLVGMAITGTLSATGTIISIIAISKEKSNKSILGLVLGLVGIALGIGLVIYRMNVWGLFSA